MSNTYFVYAFGTIGAVIVSYMLYGEWSYYKNKRLCYNHINQLCSCYGNYSYACNDCPYSKENKWKAVPFLGRSLPSSEPFVYKKERKPFELMITLNFLYEYMLVDRINHLKIHLMEHYHYMIDSYSHWWWLNIHNH